MFLLIIIPGLVANMVAESWFSSFVRIINHHSNQTPECRFTNMITKLAVGMFLVVLLINILLVFSRADNMPVAAIQSHIKKNE